MAKPILVITYPSISNDEWESMQSSFEKMKELMSDYHVINVNDPRAESVKFEVLNGEFTQPIVQMADEMEGLK